MKETREAIIVRQITEQAERCMTQFARGLIAKGFDGLEFARELLGDEWSDVVSPENRDFIREILDSRDLAHTARDVRVGAVTL